jgi:hypothetical protein
MNVHRAMSFSAFDNLFDEVRLTLSPTPSRIIQAYADFHFNQGYSRTFCGMNRTLAAIALKNNAVVHFATTRTSSWEKYAQAKSKYAFDISPPGNGLDCHRTWESLLLGMIVITWSTQLTTAGLYAGLPVVSISRWSDITPKNLELWLKKYGNVLNSSEVLERTSTHYWEQRMRSHFNNNSELHVKVKKEHWSATTKLTPACSVG